MKKLLGWFKEREGKIIGVLLGGLAFSLSPLFLSYWILNWTLKTNLLIVGTLLQIMGIIASIYTLYVNSKKYHLNNKISFRRWFSKFPLFMRRKTKKHVSSNINQSIGIKGDVDFYEEAIPKDESLEAKVEALERTLKLQNQRLTEIRKELSSKIKQQNKTIEEAKKETQQQIENLSEATKTMVFGDIHWQYIGLLWMVIGLIIFLWQAFLF